MLSAYSENSLRYPSKSLGALLEFGSLFLLTFHHEISRRQSKRSVPHSCVFLPCIWTSSTHSPGTDDWWRSGPGVSRSCSNFCFFHFFSLHCEIQLNKANHFYNHKMYSESFKRIKKYYIFLQASARKVQ